MVSAASHEEEENDCQPWERRWRCIGAGMSEVEARRATHHIVSYWGRRCIAWQSFRPSVAMHEGGSLGVERPRRLIRDRTLRLSCQVVAHQEGQGG